MPQVLQTAHGILCTYLGTDATKQIFSRFLFEKVICSLCRLRLLLKHGTECSDPDDGQISLALLIIALPTPCPRPALTGMLPCRYRGCILCML